MISISNKFGHEFSVKWASLDDASVIRHVVNQAYKELADMGLNYTATYQDEEQTRERMSCGRTLVVQFSNEIIGTIHIREENKTLSGRRSAYLGQFGILPAYKKAGLGTRVMEFVENVVREEGFESVQLDTAKTAEHLVRFYLNRGYKIVNETRFDGKTYESWIFEKTL